MGDQVQVPPPGESPPPGGGSFFTEGAQIVIVPQATELANAIDALIEEKRKFAPLICCGRLPCKGRLPACFLCPICLDCITGAGCGHNDSTHEPNEAHTL